MGERELVIKGKRRCVDDNEEDSWGRGSTSVPQF